MKTAIRIILMVLTVLFGLVSLFIPLSSSQVAKNKNLLADMQDCVRAIKEFEKKFGRLPTEEELGKIEDSLPRSYSLRYGFRFGVPPSQRDMSYPKARPESEGWMIWYWRGEWSEYYSSWDDHYSLEEQASWWGFCGPLLFAPVIAVGFFALRSLRVLRKEGPNKPPQTTPGSCAPLRV
jgi:hypothetical protein